jgi:NADPH-dependent 2,4-dienoyl-CoA reductase/sulfur reductase-like enzyme
VYSGSIPDVASSFMFFPNISLARPRIAPYRFFQDLERLQTNSGYNLLLIWDISMALEFIEEPARKTNVIHQTDVLVVGSGPGGLAAALGAARTGVDVTLIDRFRCLVGKYHRGRG